MADNTILYRLGWHSSAVYPGTHRGKWPASGHTFLRHDPLLAHPDPRRIDVRVSMLDPLQRYQIRSFQQPSAINLYVLADLSASMSLHASYSKQASLAQLTRVLAESAQVMGDRFGFIGCADTIMADWHLPATREFPRILRLAQALERTHLQAKTTALQAAWKYLPNQRALVFLVSDFHLPLAQLADILASLQTHTVIPLVFWDINEYENLPNWGLANLADMETGQQRLYCITPALRKRLLNAYLTRQAQLQECCRRYGMEPLFFTSAFSSAHLNDYLQQRVTCH